MSYPDGMDSCGEVTTATGVRNGHRSTVGRAGVGTDLLVRYFLPQGLVLTVRV
jgi:hypothetical protein